MRAIQRVMLRKPKRVSRQKERGNLLTKLKLNNYELAVLSTLKKGRPNATTGGEIATITNIPPREVYQAIHNLSTKHNVPIVGERSGIRRGYFIAETKEELLNGLKPLESQVRRELKRLTSLVAIEDLTEYETLLERG